MSKDGDHHFLPQLHLRKWEGLDGKIARWGRVLHNGKLTCKRVAPAATAYRPGLYSLAQVPSEEAAQIETEVFGRIETEAKPVLEKLIADGPASLSVRDRYWWTIYLNASKARLPHVVEKLRQETPVQIRAALNDASAEYEAIKGAASEATLMEFAERYAPARIANSAMNILTKLIFRETTIDRIINLVWAVRDVATSPRQLMISDDPLGRVGDLLKPRTLISMPLSPTHIFFATDAPDVFERISKMTSDEVVDASNVSTLRAAKEFAYGESDADVVAQHLLVRSETKE